MKRFIEGQHRTQATLLPECLDDYIGEDSPVRVIDAFVEGLDLTVLGFNGALPASTGRPSYDPAVLLKIYIYGYLNRIQSSRRLEAETQRNVELMWLTGRLTPDFKTIANFHKDNGKGIRNVCRQFVVLCRELGLLTEAVVAIDGSKFKAVNNRDRNFTNAKRQRRMQEIETSIARYLSELDSADRQRPEIAQLRTERLQEKIAALKEQMQLMKQIEVQLKDAPDGQISLTDPDARSMKTRGTGIVGYNMQAAVETRHHLIVEHEVINTGTDRDQLSSMATKACASMGMRSLTVIADRGYYDSQELLKCHEAGIAAIVPNATTSNATAEGRFGRDDFIYADKRAGGTLHKSLRCQKQRRKRYGQRERRGAIVDQVSIERRPVIVDQLGRFGDCEADLVIGAGQQQALVTLNERKSRYSLIGKVEPKTAQQVSDTMISLLKPFADCVHTVTSDNGKEFAQHARIADELEARFFFAHPYCSWERGANENMNGLIRQFFPKKMTFDSITASDVALATYSLNHRPRKCLGFKTPHEVFIAQLQSH